MTNPRALQFSVLRHLGYWLGGVLVAGAALLALYPLVDPLGAPWERAWVSALHNSAGTLGLSAAEAVTTLGKVVPIAVIGLALIVGWLVRRATWKSAMLLLNLLALAGIDFAAKPLFARARPELFARPDVHGFAFPSGHALFAVGFYGMIAYLLMWGAGRRTRIVGWSVWGLLALALGWSRLAIGVHWPTDVLSGYIAGAIVLLSQVLMVQSSQRSRLSRTKPSS